MPEGLLFPKPGPGVAGSGCWGKFAGLKPRAADSGEDIGPAETG